MMSGEKKMTRERIRSLLLSIFCPGLGELYNGDVAKAVVIVLIRVFAVLFPAAYLYSRADESLPLLSGMLAVIGLTWVYSPVAAFLSAAEKKAGRRWQRIPFYIAFFSIHWGFLVFSFFVFVSFFPIIRLSGNEGYPLYPAKCFVLCSVRALPVYQDGDIILATNNGVPSAYRIICTEEGAYIDYRDGLVSILGEDVPQTVRTADELAALGFPNDESIFAERRNNETYCIARQTGVVSKTQRLGLSRNEIFLCPDNRVSGIPIVIKKDSIAARIEWRIPFMGIIHD
jgi:hypothetical protein